jgi:hypothetical protein
LPSCAACLCDQAFTQQGGRAAKVVASQLGATGRTVDLIESLVDASGNSDVVQPDRRAAA